MIGSLDSRVPDHPIQDMWTQHKFDMKLVAPNNRRKFDVIIVGSGLAGASAAATLARAGLQRQALLLPRLAPSGAQHCRPGWHQRRQELQNDGDSDLPALLRHGQGRRLPQP